MIIVGLDDSKVAQEVLELAVRHAKAFGTTIVLVTSMKGGPDVPRREFVRAEKLLSKAEAFLQEADVACEGNMSVRGLEPGEDIVKFAEEKGAEQIIIGVKRRSKVGKLLFGSNAQYVILNAPCPVVTIR
ncbi:MAG: universal stress protein [Deltaproteobacteria bacterium]|nr:universal stress protein [Deltaproteobacteria bacterium]